MRLGVGMSVDGSPSEFIEERMEIEPDSIRVRHDSGERVFPATAKFAPAFELIGTLIGLMAMMRNWGGDDEEV